MRCKKDSIVAAIIYMACKEEGVPRTFKEISKETEISEKEIRKYYRALNKILPKGTGRTSASDLVVPLHPTPFPSFSLCLSVCLLLVSLFLTASCDDLDRAASARS
jgi:hypothetical protein